jgi:hypothetical protein
VARNYFSYTVINADQTLNAAGAAVLTSLGGVNWTSFRLSAAGAATSANVYQARSGGTAITGGTTSYNGVIEFWADPGEYKISIVDPSARIGSKDIFWSSVSGQDGGIPGTKISNDDTLVSNQIQDGTIATADIGALQVTDAKLAANSVTTAKIADLQVTGAKIADNVLPLGSVIDWYRVTTGTFVPTGWAICDGSLWNDIDNNMGVSKAKLTSGNIPNLIGKFTVGARLTVASGGSGGAADGIGSTNGDVWGAVPNYYPPSAPGIGGIGGSNAAIPGHGHAVNALTVTGDGTHSHSVGGGGNHSHTGSSGNDTPDHTHAYLVAQFLTGTSLTTNSGYAFANSHTNYGTGGASTRHTHPITVSGPGTHSHSVEGAGTHSHDVGGTIGPNTNGDAAVDVRPAHVGLLKIMKVKIV